MTNEQMSESEWTCAGCGVASPNKMRTCDCPTNVVVSLARKRAWKQDVREDLKCPGVGRDTENEQSLCFYFSRKPTDDEMRYLHEVMQRAVACRR